MAFSMVFIILVLVAVGVIVFAVSGAGKGKHAWIPLLCVGAGVVAILGVRFLRIGMELGLPSFLIPTLIPTLIIVGLIVFAIVKSGKVGLIVAGSIAGLLVLLYVGFSSVSVTPQVHQVETIGHAGDAEVSSAVWHEGVEAELPAPAPTQRSPTAS